MLSTSYTHRPETGVMPPGWAAPAPYRETATPTPTPLERLALAALHPVHELLSRGEPEAGMDQLVRLLHHIRSAISPFEWRQFAQRMFPTHPVWQFVMQGPITRSAFEKPRGYPGDAGTLDLIYGNLPPGLRMLGLAARMYSWEFQGVNCQSVRARRDIIVRILNEIAGTTPSARVLSIGCGHLREAECSSEVRQGKIGEYVALDQDPVTLAHVRRQHPGVRAECGTVRSLLSGKSNFTDFDFVYAAGLFDYLGAAVATRLVSRMFGMLRSGGRLLAVNFAPSSPEIGYMEACMDWWLTYRDEGEMRLLSQEIPAGEIRGERTFRDPLNNLVFLEIQKQ